MRFDLKHNYFRTRSEVLDTEAFSPSVKIVACIPAYKENFIELKRAVLSLMQTGLRAEEYRILILINFPKSQLESQEPLALKLQRALSSITPHVYVQAFDDKKSGVGRARKVLMDTASMRFAQINNPNGVILCFDADSTCEQNHLDMVLKAFERNAKMQAASIYFEHNLENLEAEQMQRIVEYELHLRTYIGWKKYIGLPYAFQTIGSSMAVRVKDYLDKGGMNIRKAGEDFYFLHKFTNTGNFGEIKTTAVYPSSRISDRVPFGTGRALLDALSGKKEILTYNPKSYGSFHQFILHLEDWYTTKKKNTDCLSQELIQWFSANKVESILLECKNNSSDFLSFKKRFYTRFDAFRFMKYLHQMRETHWPDVKVLDGAKALCTKLNFKAPTSNLEALQQLRQFDKSM